MTTTCIPQTIVPQTAFPTATGTATSTVADRLRTTLAAVRRQHIGSERRSMRNTPSQSALESIESFPGLHR